MTTRPTAVAGLFYPGEAATLRSQLLALLDQASVPPRPCPKAIIVPHAGYQYSGEIAARAYKLIAPHADRIRRVVLLGPSHRVAFRGIAAPTVATFSTPLGNIPLDTDTLARLAGHPAVSRRDDAHAQEHSLEVQLPFLQSVLADFTLVPLVVGECDATTTCEVIESLWGGPETLLVISSDLSHFLPYASAMSQDRQTAQKILEYRSELRGEEACGCRPLNGLLQAAKAHGLTVELLDLRNSGDTAGDRNRVVGYAAFSLI